ncbi:MAG: DMT family transporter [Ancalomicrobiaceae bacterium]|nr:DMT family transporter [Ancalomicrobiaceae bacterium]
MSTSESAAEPLTSLSADAPPVAASTVPRAGIGWNSLIGYLFAITGAVLFSTKAIAIKLAYQHPVDAETLLAIRMGLALPIYLALGSIAVLRKRAGGQRLPSARRFLAAAGCGLIGYWFASYTDFIGLLWISATFERLILITYPLFVVIIGWLFFGGRLTWGIVPSLVCAYGGLALIFGAHDGGGGTNVALGAAMVLAAAVAFALYQLLAKREIGRIGSELFTAAAMSGASAGSLVVFFLTHKVSDLAVAREILPHAAFLAIGATIVPSYFLNAALARISAEANGAIGMISPVATILLAALFLGESLSVREIAGTALVVSGVAWFVMSEKKKAAG